MLASLLAGLYATSLQAAAEPPGGHEQATPLAFSIRADPSLAGKVNQILEEVAAPTVTSLPEGSDAKAFMTTICGGITTPTLLSLVTPAGTSERVARHTPCLRVTRDRKVPVREGNTLYSLAVRNGLSSDWISRFKTIRDEKIVKAGPTQIRPGDFVLIPQVPLWTNLVTRPDKVADWNDLIGRFARVFGCGRGAEAETCLIDKGISLLPRGSYKPVSLDSPRNEVELRERRSSARDRPRDRARAVRYKSARLAAPDVALSQSAAVSMSLGSVAALVEAVPPAPAADAGQPVRVAAGQWPYDSALVSLLVQDSASRMRTGLLVGVADGGLATAAGGPLPADAFDPSAGEATDRTPEPDGNDDDNNEYVDDLVGAGVIRQVSASSLVKGDGDLRLCERPVSYGQWEAGARQRASHGSVVASLAGGLALRRQFPALASYLPKVVFYRLLPNECEPGALFEPGSVEFREAFTYLFEKTGIVNISYKVADRHRPNFLDVALRHIDGEGRLLVVSAGNDVGNLVQNNVCPACLADPQSDDMQNVRRRTIVVGAATETLGIAPGSGYGDNVVTLYAPGQPAGAVDIAGADASGWSSATSYAAPQAAFAASLLRALGVEKYYEIRERLKESTWPLSDPLASAPVGVLDLVRVAAVFRDVVEVTEIEGGTPVRKTYVGRILEPIDSLELCSPGFSRSRWHSLRLLAPNAAGDRVVRASPRRPEPVTNRYRVQETFCTPAGNLTLRSLRPGDGDKVFPLSRVNHLLLAWRSP